MTEIRSIVLHYIDILTGIRYIESSMDVRYIGLRYIDVLTGILYIGFYCMTI